MKNNPVGWFEIYVKDMARARKFYEEVLGTKLENLPAGPELQMFAFPMDHTTIGAPGSLVRMEGFDPGNNSVLIYFKSDDCRIEESRVEASGGKVVRKKMSIGQYGFVSLATDTEGNMFGLHSMN